MELLHELLYMLLVRLQLQLHGLQALLPGFAVLPRCCLEE
jgi:hypothetical protein